MRAPHRAVLPLLLLACAGVLVLALVRDHQRRGQVKQIKVVVSAQRVDRCPTCHALEAVHKDDPLLKQHPPRRFACTTCHGDGGLQVTSCLPAVGDPDGRALAGPRAQAACITCHTPAEGLPGAPTLGAGLRAFRRLGCGGCHRTSGQVTPGRPVGPPLDMASSKLNTAALQAMLATPQKIRPGTVMPSYFSAKAVTGAPTWARHRVTASRPAQLEALLADLQGLAHGLPDGDPGPGDPGQGARLFDSLGCPACHLARDAQLPRRKKGMATLGPDLRKAGDRLKGPWLFSWLRGPRLVWPGTHMPDFRLSCDEALHLKAYLMAQGSAPPAKNPKASASAETTARGRTLLIYLGCLGCHPLNADKQTRPAGPSLAGFGDKPLGRLEWGAQETPPHERTAPRWARLKLTAPLATERPGGALKMPWQHLRPGELPALEILLRGMTSTNPPAGLTARATARDGRLRQGDALVRELGCRGCHRLGGKGGAVTDLFKQTFDAPPALDGMGSRLRSGWLTAFLMRPSSVRPWLASRMPDFSLDRAKAETLAAFLAELDSQGFPVLETPPVPFGGDGRLAQAQALFDRLKCLRCHQQSMAGELKPGELAPDLALGATRLRREWLRRFILEPQTVMPGTKMPTLFPLSDEDAPSSRTTPAPDLMGGDINRQVDALTDISLWWGRVRDK